jgi:hypothetical protein
MLTRTTRKTLIFTHPFMLRGVQRTLPAGRYEVITEEELIEGLSFPAYRRISTVLLVPVPSLFVLSVEMLTVDPSDLQASLDRDAADAPAFGQNAHIHPENRTSAILD